MDSFDRFDLPETLPVSTSTGSILLLRDLWTRCFLLRDLELPELFGLRDCPLLLDLLVDGFGDNALLVDSLGDNDDALLVDGFGDDALLDGFGDDDMVLTLCFSSE